MNIRLSFFSKFETNCRTISTSGLSLMKSLLLCSKLAKVTDITHVSSRIFFSATVRPVSLSFALYTTPYVPSPIFSSLRKASIGREEKGQISLQIQYTFKFHAFLSVCIVRACCYTGDWLMFPALQNDWLSRRNLANLIG